MRIKWIDGIKGVLILMVVLGHAIQALGFPLDGSVVIRLIETLQMPMFMLVSGWLLYKEDMPLHALPRKVSRLLIPFCCWACVFFSWGCFVHGARMSTVWDYMISIIIRPDRALWFLWVLAICISLTFLVRKTSEILRANELLINVVFSLGILIFFAFSGFNKFGLQLVALYYPFVLLGYYLRCFDVENRLNVGALYAGGASFTVIYLIGMFYWRWKAAINLPLGVTLTGVTAEAYRFATSFIGCLAWMSWCWLFKESVLLTNAPLVKLGQMTLGIYAVHQTILAEMRPALSAGRCHVLIAFSLALAASILLIKLVRLNKWSSWLLLGEVGRRFK